MTKELGSRRTAATSTSNTRSTATSGSDGCRWRGASAPDGPFDEKKDVVLFADRPTTWIAVPPGSFAIFFPHDAHAPLAGLGPMKKAIVKVRA